MPIFKKKENIKIKRLKHLVNKYSGLLHQIESSKKYKVDYDINDMMVYKCTEHLIRSEINHVKSVLDGYCDYGL